MIRLNSGIVRMAIILTVTTNSKAAGPNLEPAPDGSFTIAVIPDTQKYRGRNTKADPNSEDEIRNDVFAKLTEWIASNREQQKIVFVSHVGDIVDRNIPDQWAVAQRCMNRIHGMIPYGISVGNHDMVRSGDSSLFQKYFPKSRFENFEWYGGTFQSARDESAISGNNANSFQKFTSADLDFLFLHLECNAPDDVLTWANETINRHKDRRVIVTTHMDLGPTSQPKTNKGYITDPKGRMQWKKCHSQRGNTPRQMWEKCFKHHKNLFLICSGDQSRTQTKHLVERGVHGNVVHSCLSDYGSDGSLRLYRFLPASNRINVVTYNVIRSHLTRKTSLVGDERKHQFSFEYTMKP